MCCVAIVVAVKFVVVVGSTQQNVTLCECNLNSHLTNCLLRPRQYAAANCIFAVFALTDVSNGLPQPHSCYVPAPNRRGIKRCLCLDV